jgi:hypothetical protein
MLMYVFGDNGTIKLPAQVMVFRSGEFLLV